MTANYLPMIGNGRKPKLATKPVKNISFAMLGRNKGNPETESTTISRDLRRGDNGPNHSNALKKQATIKQFPREDAAHKDLDHSVGKRNIMDKNSGSNSEAFSTSVSENDLQATTEFTFDERDQCEPKEVNSSEEGVKLRKLLRDKDQEISRLQDVIRKMSLDRERAVCTNVNSRMRITELKNKLSGEHRKTEQVTTVERLRTKQKVSSETERLRCERDEARAQLTQHETLVWQLRKQVEQLGYVSQQRYKTIQELGKKMASKDKTLQELRKRMEQAQLIQICTGAAAAERRASVTSSADTRHVAWETPSRLTTVNEK